MLFLAAMRRVTGFTGSTVRRSLPPMVRRRLHSSSSRTHGRMEAHAETEIDPGVIAGLEIIKYPDPRLRAENAEITEFDDTLKQTARRMFDLMYAAKGVGLAAPQVGINKRLMVYNEFGDPKKWVSEVVLVNPKIIEKSTGTSTEIEACLSFPDMQGDVTRVNWIKVEARNLKGKPFKKKFTGFEARIFQHEYDHLDGVVYIDHLNEADMEVVQPKLDELEENFPQE